MQLDSEIPEEGRPESLDAAVKAPTHALARRARRSAMPYSGRPPRLGSRYSPSHPVTAQTGRGVVVANPGALRWFLPLASALAHAEMLRLYCAPIATTVALQRRVATLPRQLARPVQRELALRPVPEGVDEERVCTVATLSNLALVAIWRSIRSPRVVERANQIAQRRFDRAAACVPRAGDLGVVASSGSALATLVRARSLGVPTFLDYPIAHHRFSERLLREEAKLAPRFAATLQFWALPPRVKQRLEREIELADQVLVNSTFAFRSFIEVGVPAEKLLVTPFGVDLEMFSPASQFDEQSGCEPRPFRILFAGQVTQRKGISYLLEAFKQAGLPNAELVFLGRPVGPAHSLLKSPGVRFWAPVPIYELASLYQACDVFVLPSLVEGFPQTAAIAMACGLPVIMSDNTSGRDVVEDGVNGYIVPIRDSGAIAERLRHMHAHPARRLAMGTAARRRIRVFTWTAYGQRVVDAIQERSRGALSYGGGVLHSG